MLVPRFPKQLNLVLVSSQCTNSTATYSLGIRLFSTFFVLFVHAADPPRITTHPQELKNVVQGKPAKFSIEGSGTEALNYCWLWKPAEEAGENEEWQECDVKWSKGGTLIISKVEKSNEGSYRCIVSNFAGNQTSIPANLTVGKS